MQNRVNITRITSLYGFQPSSAVLYIQKSGFKTKIACFFWSQTYPVILCLQNSVPSIRITSLYVSQPSSVVFACKTATFGSELQVSMGPRHHLSLCACNTVRLVPELLVSMGPSPHRWILNAKERLLDPKTCLYGSQTSPVALCKQYSVISARITTLYGFQPSSVVFYIQNSGFRTNITCLYGSQTYPAILCLQNSVPSIRITSLYGSQPSSVVFACKIADFGRALQVSMGTSPQLSFCA